MVRWELGLSQSCQNINLTRGYGYWAPFLLDLEETEPGCGVEEFNRVVAEYSYVTDIYSTYGQDVTAGAYTSGNPDDRPEVVTLLTSLDIFTNMSITPPAEGVLP